MDCSIDEVVKSTTNLVESIYEPLMTLEECRQTLYLLNPNLRNDVIFNEILPNIFMIVDCTRKLEE